MTGSKPFVAVVDYGIGNLRSAEKALQHVGADARLTTDPGLILDASAVVLPGVGAFGACVDALAASGLEPAVRESIDSGRAFLGICVGMQMLFDGSEESPSHRGLGAIPGIVRWLPDTVKRPQMQWNLLTHQVAHPVWSGIESQAWMYFVHSFHGVPNDPAAVLATCEYGTDVTAAVCSRNIIATQFHPEKSGHHGMTFLRNWVELVAASALVGTI